jgi:cystathionine beta-lyase family protein involved in aluminum resistance
MVSLSPILKMLGIKVTEQDVANVEALIPQIPAKATEIVVFVNNAVTNFHQRLEALEKTEAMNAQKIDKILEYIQNGRTDSSSASDATGTGHDD